MITVTYNCKEIATRLVELRNIKMNFDSAIVRGGQDGIDAANAVLTKLDDGINVLDDMANGHTKYIVDTLLEQQKNYHQPFAVLPALAGVGSEVAMEMREKPIREFWDAFENLKKVKNELVVPGDTFDKTLQDITYAEQELETKRGGLSSIAQSLIGVGTPESIDMRENLLQCGINPLDIINSLTGIATSEAMALRERILKNSLDIISMQESFGLINTEQVESRKQQIEQGNILWEIAESLAGVDSPESLKMREDLYQKGALAKAQIRNAILNGLACVSSPESMELRQTLVDDAYDELGHDSIIRTNREEFELKEYMVSLLGVDTPEAMDMRRKLLVVGGYNWSIARSLVGIGSTEAMAIRETLLNTKSVMRKAEEMIGLSLAGVGTSEAMAMRERLVTMANDRGVNLEHVAWSLVGVNSPESNAFREKYLQNFRGRTFTTPRDWLATAMVCRYGFEK